jgi:tetratricopeptide (TPR) repeat protein
VQDQAWFLRGEIHFAIGDRDAALEAYHRVIELNPARTGQLVRRAQRRIDEIRFGEDS